MRVLCDPCGVDGGFWTTTRWCRCAQPPATLWQAFGLLPKHCGSGFALLRRQELDIRCHMLKMGGVPCHDLECLFAACKGRVQRIVNSPAHYSPTTCLPNLCLVVR